MRGRYVILVVSVWLALASAGEVIAGPVAPPAPSPEHSSDPLEGIRSTGQPTPEEIEAAAKAGVRTVINLRTDGEPGFEWEQALVERLGLHYVRIPVAGAAGLTRPNVERLDAALDEGLARGPVLLHCASGNRNGALLALREAWLEGASPEAALEVGKAAGLTRLLPATQELLGLPTGEAPPSPPAER